jgi:non-ribosomal peptide synthetase component E (peptide arylation enzyme)
VDRVAVTGAPDDVLGEIGVAVVVPRGDDPPDLEALRAHVSTTLADYKAPDALVLVTELPLTPMMKVDPGRLADLAAEAALERAARVSQSRRSGAGVLGSAPNGAPDEKERA